MQRIKNEKVIQTIYSAVDEVNQLLPKGKRLKKSRDTVLSGPSGKLDSLGLVNLIVTTEQNIEEEFGVTITLTDIKETSHNPFETIGTLVDYITLLLEDKSSE